MTESTFIQIHVSKGWKYTSGKETLFLDFKGHKLEWLLGGLCATLLITTNVGVEHELRLKYHNSKDDLKAIKSILPTLLNFSWEQLEPVGL